MVRPHWLPRGLRPWHVEHRYDVETRETLPFFERSMADERDERKGATRICGYIGAKIIQGLGARPGEIRLSSESFKVAKSR